MARARLSQWKFGSPISPQASVSHCSSPDGQDRSRSLPPYPALPPDRRRAANLRSIQDESYKSALGDGPGFESLDFLARQDSARSGRLSSAALNESSPAQCPASRGSPHSDRRCLEDPGSIQPIATRAPAAPPLPSPR